jgi:predicted nucleic acid-binding protein
MLVLDTDHLSELHYARRLGLQLRERLEASGAAAMTTIVTAEEMLKGRIALAARARTVAEQVESYS